MVLFCDPHAMLTEDKVNNHAYLSFSLNPIKGDHIGE